MQMRNVLFLLLFLAMLPFAIVAGENFQTRLERIMHAANSQNNVGVGAPETNDIRVIVPSVLARHFEASYWIYVDEFYFTSLPVNTNSPQARKIEQEGWKPADTVSVSGWALRFKRDTVIFDVWPDSAEWADLQSEEGVIKFFRRHSVPNREPMHELPN